jgi:hypothetical protein
VYNDSLLQLYDIKKKNLRQVRLALKRDIVPVPQVVLYRPWTKMLADEVVRPIQASTQLRDAVKRAYYQSFIQPVVDAGKSVMRKMDQLLS